VIWIKFCLLLKGMKLIGDIGTFSFHETKNIICGEGGLLILNDDKYSHRSEIIWEKGTNRSAFFRGEVDKYGWVDVGSSFLPSDMIAAFLFAQLENLKEIQNKRISIWERYYEELKELESLGKVRLPHVPDYATNNGHLFYIGCDSLKQRGDFISYLNGNGISAVFHYLPLHQSPFFENQHDGRDLPNTNRYADTLVRLPLYFELSESDQRKIIQCVKDFF